LPGKPIANTGLSVILADIAPKSAIEWLLAVDVIELSWEIERYRLLRHKILMQYREPAIEQCLRRIDLLEISSEADGLAHQRSAAMLGAGETT
jgi:hypothetical protein